MKNKKFKLKLNFKTKLFILTTTPIFLLAVITLILTNTIVKQSLISEVKQSLKGAATATFAAYDQNSGDYIQAENGDIWKGSYNISKSESIVDSIKEKTGMEVTFFYNDTRIMTSAKDENGDRILGSPAGDNIKKMVLESGEEYFSDSVSIDGTLYYGYYVPVTSDSSSSPIGMIFVGSDKARNDTTINRIANTISIVIIVTMLISIVVAFIFSMSITRSLKKSISSVQQTATGDLKTSIDGSLLRRKDELGDLSNAIATLQTEMNHSIENIAQNAAYVLESSATLEDTATTTTASLQDMSDAVHSISDSANIQADISNAAAQNIQEMGNKIQQTTLEMQEMKQNTTAMHDSEKLTVETIEKLLKSNNDVQTLINEISHQTLKTNDSVQKIKAVTEIISSIADETSLLSLNASIEAARAGESGKGFAVVAEQIQKLAAQSSDSSERINGIILQLTQDSDASVKTISKVTQTMQSQTLNMKQTQDMTAEVVEKLNQSMQSMNSIENSIRYLDSSRNEIVQTVEKLLNIACDNVATTEEVCATASTVTENFSQVTDSTKGLKNIANDLEASIKHFHY